MTDMLGMWWMWRGCQCCRGAGDGDREPITVAQPPEKTDARAIAEKQEWQERSWGEEKELSARDHKAWCPSLSSLFNRQADSRHWATAFTRLTVATERQARKSSLTAAGFEGHLKNTTRQSRDGLHFQITPGNQSPLPLSPYHLSPLPSPSPTQPLNQ